MKRQSVLGFLVFAILVFISGSAFAQMAFIDAIVEGDKTIDADTQLLSIIQGNVIVNAGVTLQLDGIVTGSVTVEAGGNLVLNGIVNGDVTLKEGASITLEGIVGGNVYNQSGNPIDPGTINGIVKGEIINS